MKIFQEKIIFLPPPSPAILNDSSLILKFQISLHRRRRGSHFLNGNEAQMTSQLQYQNQVEVIFLYNSEIHEHSQFTFSGIIVFLSSNQNKLITLLPFQPK